MSDGARITTLMVDLRPGQVVKMAGCTIEALPRAPQSTRGGRVARLRITAPADVRIERPMPRAEAALESP